MAAGIQPDARQETPVPLSARHRLASRIRGTILASAAIAAAFGLGLMLGRSPSATDSASDRSTSPVAEAFGAEDRAKSDVRSATEALAPKVAESISNREEMANTANGHTAHRKLRLRSTASVSSGVAKPGDPILFVTEESLENQQGERIPAGTIVQGIVSQAERSTATNPGSLVIEIRAMYVGNRAIPVHALPHTSVPDPIPALEQTAGSSKKSNSTNEMQVRTSLKVKPEAVVPRQGVIEVELVETDSDFSLGVPTSIVPVAPVAPPVVPTAPEEPSAPSGDPLPNARPKRLKIPSTAA